MHTSMTKILVLVAMIALMVLVSVFYEPESHVEWIGVIGELRLKRGLGVLLTGFVTGFTGCVIQRLLNNPLIDSHILGVSMAGQTFSTIASTAGFPVLISFGLTSFLWSLTGSLSSIFLLFLLVNRSLNSDDKMMVPLLGFVFNAFFSSLLLFYSSIVAPENIAEVQSKLLGFLTIQDFDYLSFVTLVTACAVFALLRLSKKIQIMGFGSEFAFVNGVSFRKTYLVSLTLVCIMVSLVVAGIGYVGFLGIIVPEFSRRFFLKETERWLASGMIGSLLLLFSDFIAKNLLYPRELPLGLFLGLAGIPFVAWQMVNYSRGRV